MIEGNDSLVGLSLAYIVNLVMYVGYYLRCIYGILSYYIFWSGFIRYGAKLELYFPIERDVLILYRIGLYCYGFLLKYVHWILVEYIVI